MILKNKAGLKKFILRSQNTTGLYQNIWIWPDGKWEVRDQNEFWDGHGGHDVFITKVPSIGPSEINQYMDKLESDLETFYRNF